MRNAYLLVNFGDFVDGTSNTATPYVQLLSTSNDTAKVHTDFVNVRLGGKDSTVNLNDGTHNTSSSSSSSSPKNWWSNLSSTTKKIIIGAAAGAVLLLVLLVGFCCCCRGKKGRAGAGTMGFGGQSYKQLNEPAPDSYALPNVGYQQPPGYGQQPHSQQQYQTAWDHRY